MRETAGSSGDVHRHRIGAVHAHGAGNAADAGSAGDGIKRTASAGRYVAVIGTRQGDVDAAGGRERTGLCAVGGMRHRDRFGVQGFGLIAGKRCREGEAVLGAVDGHTAVFGRAAVDGVAAAGGNQLHLDRHAGRVIGHALRADRPRDLQPVSCADSLLNGAGCCQCFNLLLWEVRNAYHSVLTQILTHNACFNAQRVF